MGDFAELTQLLESLILDQGLEEFKELLEPKPEASITLDNSRNKTTMFSYKGRSLSVSPERSSVVSSS